MSGRMVGSLRGSSTWDLTRVTMVAVNKPSRDATEAVLAGEGRLDKGTMVLLVEHCQGLLLAVLLGLWSLRKLGLVLGVLEVKLRFRRWVLNH